MESKRDKARRLINEGKNEMAIKLVKQFDLIYSASEIRILEIAHECNSGKEKFYQQLGEDTNKIKLEAINLLKKMIQ